MNHLTIAMSSLLIFTTTEAYFFNVPFSMVEGIMRTCSTQFEKKGEGKKDRKKKKLNYGYWDVVQVNKRLRQSVFPCQ